LDDGWRIKGGETFLRKKKKGKGFSFNDFPKEIELALLVSTMVRREGLTEG